MTARRIIEGAAFGPEVLKVAVRAFDEAWANVSHIFTQAERETVRQILAHSVMSLTRDDSQDAEQIRDAAVRALRRKYPSRFSGSTGGRKEQPGQ